MTWVKICGITNLEDALVAVEAGADALGFVFYEKSPRRVDPAAAREIVAQLPERIEKIGVFVDLAQEQLAEIVNDSRPHRSAVPPAAACGGGSARWADEV